MNAHVSSTRRRLIRSGAAWVATGALAGSAPFAPSRVWAQAAAGLPMPDVKALVFDTFGTVVDWRNGVAREVQRILKPMGYDLDWLAFADAWRNEYGPSMDEVRSGRRPFVKLDILHRENLDRIRPRFKVEKLEDATLAELTLAWHKLDAWPDVGPAFARLHKRFLMAPCSNDLMTCEALNLKPEQVMMCAAHSNDLSSAQMLGLRTGHIGRPGESGPGTGETAPRGSFDVVGKNFHDFADKLGV
jgi:2-haloacid dehalogenase